MTPLKNLLLEKEGSCEHAKCGCEEHLGRLPFQSAGIPFLKSSAEDPPAIPKCIEGTMVLQVVLETGVGSLALPSPHGFFFFPSGFAKCHLMVTLRICEMFTAYSVWCAPLAHRAEGSILCD